MLLFAEIVNAVSAVLPWAVTAALLALAAQVPPPWAWLVLVGWSFHVPCAVAYHLLLSAGRAEAADVMLRMDHSTQLLAAVTNLAAQSEGNVPAVALLAAMCASGARDLVWADVSTPLDVGDGGRTRLLAAALVVSCFPIALSGGVAALAVCAGSLVAGGAAVFCSAHALRYSVLHLCLAAFAYGLMWPRVEI